MTVERHLIVVNSSRSLRYCNCEKPQSFLISKSRFSISLGLVAVDYLKLRESFPKKKILASHKCPEGRSGYQEVRGKLCYGKIRKPLQNVSNCLGYSEVDLGRLKPLFFEDSDNAVFGGVCFDDDLPNFLQVGTGQAES